MTTFAIFVKLISLLQLAILTRAKTELRGSSSSSSPLIANTNPGNVDRKHDSKNKEKLSRIKTLVKNDRIEEHRHLTTYEDLTDLEKRWYLGKPEFSYHGYEVRLEYNISANIDSSALGYHIYDGIDCSKGNDEIGNYDNDYLFSSLEQRNSKQEQGEEEQGTENISNLSVTNFNSISVRLRIDTDRIRFTPLYVDYGGFEQINFCVRLSASHWERALNKTIEVNWIETPVLLTMNSLSFEIGESPFGSAYSVYETRDVEVRVCDIDSNVVEATPDVTEGKLLRLCVEAGNSTVTEGGTLWYVEEFSYTRSVYTQQAIEPRTGGAPAPASSPMQCDPDSSQCYFETYLGLEFFTSPGIIDGYGTAFIQFGEISNPTEGATEMSENIFRNTEATRIVPVHFGLKMVALPSDDRYDTSSSSDRTYPFGFYLLSCALHILLATLW